MGMISEFKEFISRGNVVDLAVGVVIGAAFGKIVSSLVDGIVMPAIGAFTKGASVSDWKYVIKPAQLDSAGKEIGKVGRTNTNQFHSHEVEIYPNGGGLALSTNQHEHTIASFSRPWNALTVATSTSSGRRATCAEYGVITPIASAGTPASRRRDTASRTRATSPGLNSERVTGSSASSKPAPAVSTNSTGRSVSGSRATPGRSHRRCRATEGCARRRFA